jgi:hypothetical protein
MSDGDHEQFEAELRKLAPARPPAELMARLTAVCCERAGVSRGFGARRSAGAFDPHGAMQKRQRTGALQDAGAAKEAGGATITRPAWRLLIRWLAPAAGVAAVVALVVWWPSGHEDRRNSNQQLAATKPALKADNVEFDQQLVASFDAVARLPSGQPVRFRCREWADAVVLRDSASGIVVEQRTPRLEVVPVSFETY